MVEGFWVFFVVFVFKSNEVIQGGFLDSFRMVTRKTTLMIRVGILAQPDLQEVGHAINQSC